MAVFEIKLTQWVFSVSRGRTEEEKKPTDPRADFILCFTQQDSRRLVLKKKKRMLPYVLKVHYMRKSTAPTFANYFVFSAGYCVNASTVVPLHWQQEITSIIKSIVKTKSRQNYIF